MRVKTLSKIKLYKKSKNTGYWIGVSKAIGAAAFGATNEPC